MVYPKIDPTSISQASCFRKVFLSNILYYPDNLEASDSNTIHPSFLLRHNLQTVLENMFLPDRSVSRNDLPPMCIQLLLHNEAKPLGKQLPPHRNIGYNKWHYCFRKILIAYRITFPIFK